VVPLGGSPPDEPGWRLLLSLLDLLLPVTVHREDVDSAEIGIHGASPAAAELRREIRQLAPTALAVLLLGETGVGKEVAARALHRLSGRTGAFVPVNVAAIPAELMESELFGSVRGAFTGSDRSRRGLVDAADQGTLFLDEIGDLDLPLQVKLLRFLESMEVRPVGSDRFHRVDLRIVSATNRDLERRVHDGRFRPDLKYRIANVPVCIPPLRERRQDIPQLKALFEAEAVARNGMLPCRWSRDAEQRLAGYRWPGNVRELRHVVEVAMVRAAGGTVTADDLPLGDRSESPGGRWDDAINEFRRRFLESALDRHSGNRSATARELGISRQALLYHIRNLGLASRSE
jgi:sigma-54-dependent transcriptional regulator